MEKLAVIGSGTMGHSVALAAAWAGIEVRMFGISEEDIRRGLDEITMKLRRLETKGVLDVTEINEIRKRIKTTSSLPQVTREATFVIEAVPEKIQLKKELFEQLGTLCEKEVILASNTSGLSPSFFISSIPYPERFLVTHFWNPAHLIPLVEVVPSVKTNKSTIERTLDFLLSIKKKPILLRKEVPGFVANRLQFALFREAQYLLEQGVASKEDIDAAVTFSFGRRLSVTGPLASADMGGLDIFATISDYLFGDLSIAAGPLGVLKDLVEKGNLGSKTGTGFYNWTQGFSDRMNSQREDELIRHLENDFKPNEPKQ